MFVPGEGSVARTGRDEATVGGRAQQAARVRTARLAISKSQFSHNRAKIIVSGCYRIVAKLIYYILASNNRRLNYRNGIVLARELSNGHPFPAPLRVLRNPHNSLKERLSGVQNQKCPDRWSINRGICRESAWRVQAAAR